MDNNKKLTRSRSDRMLAGVCGGLAAYFGLDPSLVRIGYALLTFFTVFAGFEILIIHRVCNCFSYVVNIITTSVC